MYAQQMDDTLTRRWGYKLWRFLRNKLLVIHVLSFVLSFKFVCLTRVFFWVFFTCEGFLLFCCTSFQCCYLPRALKWQTYGLNVGYFWHNWGGYWNNLLSYIFFIQTLPESSTWPELLVVLYGPDDTWHLTSDLKFFKQQGSSNIYQISQSQWCQSRTIMAIENCRCGSQQDQTFIVIWDLTFEFLAKNSRTPLHLLVLFFESMVEKYWPLWK